MTNTSKPRDINQSLIHNIQNFENEVIQPPQAVNNSFTAGPNSTASRFYNP